MLQQDLGVYVKSLSFHNGTKLDLHDNSIVVFVGPNNSGKSLSLREIQGLIGSSAAATKSIKSVELQKIGSLDHLFRRLSAYKNEDEKYYRIADGQYNFKSRDEIAKMWSNDEDVGALSQFFLMYLSTSNRLSDSNPADMFDALRVRTGEHPIHSMYLDSDKENEVSDIFREYFNSDLIVHRSAGNKIPLYVGNRPGFEGNETATSRSYLNKIERLDPLHEQGDGFRSFASLLLRVRTGTHSIILVDEPEAFLHPPQARAVAEVIASGIDFQKQVFVATHSNDVIQGILSRFSDRVSIVRLERGEHYNKATPLSNERIAELWNDPILRYSNCLNGIFHNQVIVAESDSDCRFFEAIADVVKQDNISTFYTYAGGKDRIPVIVRALEGLQVPTRTVVDMDIIATDQTLRRIIEAYGLDWGGFSSKLISLKNVVQSRKTWLLGNGFKERVSAILKEIRDTELVPQEALQRIRSAMRETSPWEGVKSSGVAAFPQGDPAKNIRDLLLNLRMANIFVVPVGEIERFCPTANSHGPRWVAEVLQRDLKNDAELAQARAFVESLIDFGGRVVGPSKAHSSAPAKRIQGRYRDLRMRDIRRSFDIVIRLGKALFFVGFGTMFFVFAFILLAQWIGSKMS